MEIDKLTISIETEAKGAYRSLGNLIKRLENLQKGTSGLIDTSEKFDKLAASINKLKEASKNVKLSNLESSVNKAGSAAKRNQGYFKELTDKWSQSISKGRTLFGVVKEIYSAFNNTFTKSNAYIETINLFTVTMGKASKSAMNYAEEVRDAMGIDLNEWLNYQGTFKQLTRGFGVVEEKANTMSQQLTQLSYDLASFFNTDVETAFEKLSSAMSGQVKGLREFGIDTTVASLQEYALSQGIEQSVSSMSQAQKSLLRYNYIMERSIKIQGDMARTIITPANSVRILNAQLEQLRRAFGNIISVIAVKVIPYVQAFVRIVTEAFEGIAKMLGFEMPTIDYSGLDDVFGDTAENANETVSAVKEIKKQLMGFDELNIISKPTSSGSSGGTSSGNDLDIPLKTYDFLKGLDEVSDKIYKNMKKITDMVTPALKLVIQAAPYAITIAGLLKLISAAKGFKTVKDFIMGTWGGKLTGVIKAVKNVAITAMATVVSAWAGYNFFYKLEKGCLGVVDAIGSIVVAAAGIGTAFALTGPVGGVIAIIGLVTGAIIGLQKAHNEMIRDWVESTDAYARMQENIRISTEATNEAANAVENLKNKEKEAQESLSQYSLALTLADEIFELAEKTNKSQEEVEILKTKIQTLNDLKLDGIKLEYDKFRDAVIDTATGQQAVKDNIEDIIKGLQRQAKAAALQELLTEAYKTQAQVSVKLKENQSAYKDTLLDVAKYQKRVNELSEAYTKITAEIDNPTIARTAEEYLALIDAQQKTNEEYQKYAELLAEAQSSEKTTRENLLETQKSYNETTEQIQAYTDQTLDLQGVLEDMPETKVTEISVEDSEFNATMEQVNQALEPATKSVTITATDNATGKIQSMISLVKNPLTFTVSVDYKTSESGKTYLKNMQKLNDLVSAPKTKKQKEQDDEVLRRLIGGFANGGFVDEGEMFVAREAGPELVGRIGKKTAVANNDQIVKGISAGVYNAMVAASTGNKQGGTYTFITNLDGKQVAKEVFTIHNNEVRQTGQSPLLV